MDAMSASVRKSINAMVAQYASAAVIIAKTKQVISEGVNFNKFVESSTIAFGVMMKSAEAAKDEVQSLYDFAVKSPLTFKETVTASKQLMAYGFAVKDLIPTMEMLGTVAMATGHSLEDISYVYGTLRAQQRVYTRDLMQFGMRGIPIYEELSTVLGVPVNQIQKMTSEGKVMFSDVEQAFKNMTSEGGRFSGMMEQYMTTLQGKESMLSDIWQQDLGTLTSGLTDQIKKIVDKLTTVFSSDSFKSYLSDIGSVLATITNIAGSLLSFIASNIGILTTLLGIIVGLKILNLMPKILESIGIAISSIQFGTLIANLKNSVIYITLIGNTIKAVSVSLVSFVAANPAVLAAFAAITAVVIAGTIAFKAYKKEFNDIKKAAAEKQKSLKDESKQMSTASSSYEGLTSVVQSYYDIIKSNNSMSSSGFNWTNVINAWADKLGVARDDIAQVLFDMGKIGKNTASLSGFSPKISTKGYSTELNEFSKVFASSALSFSGMADDQIDAMYRNAKEKISFTTTDIHTAFASIKDSNPEIAKAFASMLSSMGIDVDSFSTSMSDKFSNAFNDPNSKLTAYFSYMDKLGQETSTDIMETVAAVNPAIASAMSDDIKTVVSKNITIYQTALEDLTKTLKTQNPAISSVQLQANDLYKLYTERMEYWINKLPDKAKKPAKEIAEKFYQEVSAYFDDWKIKLTLSGVDDMMHELQSSLQDVYNNLQKKNTEYQNAQGVVTSAQAEYTKVKGKGGTSESNATTVLNNAIAKMAVAGDDLVKYSAYAYQAIPEMIQYYNQQIDNLHFSELANGIDTFWDNIGGDAYKNLSSGIEGLSSKTRTLGSTFSSAGKIVMGSMEALGKSLLQGTQLGDLISAFASTNEQENTNEQIMSDQISTVTTAATNALNAISAYFTGQPVGTVPSVSDSGTSSASGSIGNIVSAYSGNSVSTLLSMFTSNLAGASTAVSGAASSATGASSAMSGVSGAAGGLISVIIQLAMALANALANDNTWGDSSKKLVNLFDTIADKLEPFISLISEILGSPIVELLESFGSALGSVINFFVSALQAFDPILITTEVMLKLLSAVLQVVANVFSWLYDSVIVPVGNKVIDMINGIIKAINNTFSWAGVHLDYIDKLQKTTDLLEDLNDILDNSKSALSQTIDYLTNKINDAVDDQLDSLKDLYEAGAISATDYQTQAEALNVEKISSDDELVSDADKALTSMSSIYDRLYALYTLQDAIENDDTLSDSEMKDLYETYGISSESSQSAMKTAIQAALKAYNDANVTAVSIANGTKTSDDSSSDDSSSDDDDSGIDWGKVVEGVATGGVSTIIDGIGDAFGWWDTGSTNILADQAGIVHKGEAVVPKTFMDGIRAGDLALTGPDAASSSGDTYISLTVNGSVMQESDLADTIATRIYKMRAKGTATV